MKTKTQVTEHFEAPVPEVAVAPIQAPMQYVSYTPRPKTIERQGNRTEPVSHRMPQIRGGICEWCGVKDHNLPSQMQYQLCDHFRGLGEMRCSYCEDSKDPTDVVIHAVLNIAEHPSNPDQLVVWCNSYECSRKHEARFKVNR